MEHLKKTCVFYKGFILASEEFHVIRKKGASNINRSSIEKGDDLVIEVEEKVQEAICEKLALN